MLARLESGELPGFSAICTHAGCCVAPRDGLTLKCPCHGSTFDASTGKRLSGKAQAPLPRVRVKVEGDQVFVD